jgi:hypothetical protein
MSGSVGAALGEKRAVEGGGCGDEKQPKKKPDVSRVQLEEHSLPSNPPVCISTGR